MVAHLQHDWDAARTLFEECLQISRELGDRPAIIRALRRLALVEQEEGDYARAATFYQECLLCCQEQGGVLDTVKALEDLVGLAGQQGQYLRAVRLMGAAETLCAPLGRTLPVGTEKEYTLAIDAASAALSAEAFAAARAEGQAMTQEEAVAYAMEPETVSPTNGSPVASEG